MTETILEKSQGRVSYHNSVEEMLKHIRSDGLTNVFDRWVLQEKIRCKFCPGRIKLSALYPGPLPYQRKVRY